MAFSNTPHKTHHSLFRYPDPVGGGFRPAGNPVTELPATNWRLASPQTQQRMGGCERYGYADPARSPPSKASEDCRSPKPRGQLPPRDESRQRRGLRESATALESSVTAPRASAELPCPLAGNFGVRPARTFNFKSARGRPQSTTSWNSLPALPTNASTRPPRSHRKQHLRDARTGCPQCVIA